jgi:2,3-bisphosphoglycerate-independent phosphoglycerate mutase
MKDSMFPMADALVQAYRSGEDDETMEPLVLYDKPGKPVGTINDGDYVIFYNIRGEREIQLTQSFTDPEFSFFKRQEMKSHWVSMIEYHRDLDIRVAFPPLGTIHDTLSEVVSKAGLKQVKIVESEKRVHVTFFLNGKRNEKFPNEEWKIIPSLEFEGYLPPPTMQAEVVADSAIESLRNPDIKLIVVNWANVDVLGHSENRAAITQAVSHVDTQLARVVKTAEKMDVASLITADHGTVEKWLYPDGAIDTGHTDSPVPFTVVAPNNLGIKLRENGSLIDIAPTVLDLLGINKPELMTGSSLLLRNNEESDHYSRVALLILDGWGARDEVRGNLIIEAETPVMDRISALYPYTRLKAAGEAVGLPNTVPNRPGMTVGNSEVGHLHIGAGRVVPTDRLRIENAIEEGTFYKNPEFLWAMNGAKRDKTNLHLLGIISFYSSHGSVEHLKALLHMAEENGVPNVFIHGMLGRRGEKPESGANYIRDIEAECRRVGLGVFTSLIGRFWALDREHNWDRIEKSYRWLVYGEGRPVFI